MAANPDAGKSAATAAKTQVPSEDELVREVLELHERDHNCAQSMACAFAQITPFNEDALFAVMEGFGAGMGDHTETCGAVSAGAAIISLLVTDGRAKRTTKLQTYEVVGDFVRRFVEENQTTTCHVLKKLSSVEKPHTCDAYMESAARLLVRTIEDHGLAPRTELA